MSKRLLYTVGGSLAVLLASLAVYSTVNDQSNFSIDRVESLSLSSNKGEAPAFLNFVEEPLFNNQDPNFSSGVGSPFTPNKMNLPLLVNAS